LGLFSSEFLAFPVPVPDPEVVEVLRNVFRSGLANWSAANVSSPSLLPPLLVEEDKESAAETLARGRGLGFDDGATEAGRSRTKSGVCFCFCCMEVLWLQKSLLERNPPRRLPMLSEPADDKPETDTGFVLCSQRVLFLLKPALASPWPDELTCSLDAQLDCLSMTGGILSLLTASDIEDLGAGSGGLENLRGRAPPAIALLPVEPEIEGNVLLMLIFSAVFLLTIGFGCDWFWSA